MQVLLATFISFTAAAVCATGLAIPWWVVGEISIAAGDFPFSEIIWVQYHRGLWQECVDGRECIDIANGTDLEKDVRDIEIAGSSVAGAAGLLALIQLICFTEITLIAKMAGVLEMAAGVLMISGITVFAAKKNDTFGSNSKFESGFALCIISAIFSFIGGILYCVSKSHNPRRQRQASPPMEYSASLSQSIPTRDQSTESSSVPN